MNELTIRLSASFAGTVGYGHVFKCKVEEVVDGDFDESSVTITVLSNDKDLYEKISGHLSPDELIIEFKKRKENEPNSMMPITGFVDKKRTSWEILSIKTK